MKRKNFNGRKQIRQQSALDRLLASEVQSPESRYRKVNPETWQKQRQSEILILKQKLNLGGVQ